MYEKLEGLMRGIKGNSVVFGAATLYGVRRQEDVMFSSVIIRGCR